MSPCSLEPMGHPLGQRTDKSTIKINHSLLLPSHSNRAGVFLPFTFTTRPMRQSQSQVNEDQAHDQAGETWAIGAIHVAPSCCGLLRTPLRVNRRHKNLGASSDAVVRVLAFWHCESTAIVELHINHLDKLSPHCFISALW